MVTWRGRLISVPESDSTVANRENWLLKKKNDKPKDGKQQKKQCESKSARRSGNQSGKPNGRRKSGDKVGIPPERVKAFVDSWMQTDPDPLLDDVVVVDGQERVVWTSEETLQTSPSQPSTSTAIVHAIQAVSLSVKR